jgi:enoyl-CoA hydratase
MLHTRVTSFISLCRRCCSASTYQFIKVEKCGKENKIGKIELYRPKALNALCNGLMNEVCDAITKFDNDDSVNCMVITGSEKAFAAGADIKEMCGQKFSNVYGTNMFCSWEQVASARKPLIAAVNGFALGGGNELAMMCDIIYAGEKAKFAQPEIKLGTIPGGGGTQRLIRAVGKSRAMEIILTGDMITAQEACSAGLVSKVFPPEQLLEKTMELAGKIASMSPIILKAAKEAVNAADNLPLTQGLQFEKRLFHATFATNDCKEGMTAFAEKREAKFTNS